MKKKLLTILLSVFMMVTTFTSNVFAATDFEADGIKYRVKSSEPPYTVRVMKKSVPYSGSITIPEEVSDGSKSYTVNEISSNAFANSSITDITIPDTVTNIDDNAFNNCQLLTTLICNAVTPPTLGDGVFEDCLDTLKIQVPATSVEAYKTASGWSTYAGKIEAITLTITDILPDNFPSSLTDVAPDNPWINGKGSKLYVGVRAENGLKYLYCDGQRIINCGHGVTENVANYEIVDSAEGTNIVFVMDDNTLDRIVISGYTGDNDVFNGTYRVPSVSYSIENLLNDYCQFLLESPDNKFTNGNASLYIGLHPQDYKRYMHFAVDGGTNDSSNDAIDDIAATSISSNKYTADNDSFDYGVPLHYIFTINENKLVSIDISGFTGDSSILNGTYTAPVTIADVLGTVVDGFPTTSETGWFNDNGMKVYKDNVIDVIHFDQSVDLSKPLQKDGDNYKYSIGTNIYTFVMTSGKLTSINIEGVTGFGVNYNGEFFPHKYNNDPISKPIGYSGDLTFITNAHYNGTPSTVKVYIKLQGQSEELLDAENYILDYGSTKVTLKGNYVSTLPAGTHTIKIHVDGYGDVAQEFNITSVPSPSPTPKPRYVVPKTGVE